VANTTWSTTDKLNITLSGSNLTAVGASNAIAGVRAADANHTGKFYFEITFVAWSLTNTYAGLTTLDTNLGALVGDTQRCAGVIKSGHIYVNGSDTGSTLGTRAAGNIISVAVDIDAQLIWFRVAPSGNWNGSATADPATGTGGISIAALFVANNTSVVPVFNPVFYLDKVTANFGDTSFSGTAPGGYTGGWTSGASAPVGAYLSTTLRGLAWVNADPAFAATYGQMTAWTSYDPDLRITSARLVAWVSTQPLVTTGSKAFVVIMG